jgi:hypothetical protein
MMALISLPLIVEGSISGEISSYFTNLPFLSRFTGTRLQVEAVHYHRLQ